MIKNKLLRFLLPLLIVFLPSCGKTETAFDKPYETEELVFKERIRNTYAEKFAIDRYENGCSMLYIADGNRYLVVPAENEIPEKLDDSIRIIKRPAENIYLAATSAMEIFDTLECGNAIRFSGTKTDDWHIEYAKKAMENGRLLYAGKYREPDYELLLSEKCGLSIQSTMIEHCPEVKEKLEELGITVFVDYSSYEPHPLGRSEWIRVYGEIAGKTDSAEKRFAEQTGSLKTDGYDDTGKTAVYFYINSSGQAVTRKPGDYITKMIEISGGKNVFEDIGNKDSSSTITMEMEEFYSTAKEADFIIYNSTIDGKINSIDSLIEKNSLIADFKAVKEGNVWCTEENLFQETMKLAAVISDFNTIFTGKENETPPQFLYKPEGIK